MGLLKRPPGIKATSIDQNIEIHQMSPTGVTTRSGSKAAASDDITSTSVPSVSLPSISTLPLEYASPSVSTVTSASAMYFAHGVAASLLTPRMSTSASSAQHPSTSALSAQRPSTSASASESHRVVVHDDDTDDDDTDSTYEIANTVSDSGAPAAARTVQDIRAELEMLRAQEELLLARARVAELQRGTHRAEARRIRAEDVEYLIPTFSGDDEYSVTKWFQDFDHLIDELGGDETDKYHMARHLIRDTGRMYLRTIRVRTYAQLKTAMLTRYERHITSTEVLRKLDRRVKRTDESLIRYITCMQEIAQQATISEFELVIKIISGLRDTSGMVSVLGTARSVNDLIALLPMYEQMVENVAQRTQTSVARLQVSSSSRMQLSSASRMQSAASNATNPGAAHQVRRPSATPAGTTDEVRCYNCGGYGHMSAVCPKPRRAPGSCFTCGSTEHQKQTCPKRRNAVANIASEETQSEDDAAESEAELLQRISRMPLVSVSFQNKRGNSTKSFSLRALIDSGSPASFVRRSLLPLGFVSTATRKSKYFGLKNVPIYIHEIVNCELTLYNRTKTIQINVVPDDALPFEILLGRDMLDIFGIEYHFRDRIDNLRIKIAKLRKILLRYAKLVSAGRTDEVNEKSSKLPSIDNSSFDILSIEPDVLSDLKSNIGSVAACDSSNAGNSHTRHTSEFFADEIDATFADNVGVLLSVSDLSGGDNLRIDRNALFGHTINRPSEYSIEHDCELDDDQPEISADQFDIGPTWPVSTKNQIRDLISSNYVNVSEASVVVPHYEMSLQLVDDVPFYSRPRRLSHFEKIEVDQMVEEMLEQGVVRHSESPYASPIVLVKKKNGKTRMCVDYRTLNKKTVRNNFPLPLVDDCLEYLNKKKVFTLLDLKSGFHQVKVAESSRKYTSFVTPSGQYEYLKMPFGLKNAPAVFQKFINRILADFIAKKEIVVYMDDILVASTNLDDHMKLLSDVLSCIAKNGLKLQLSKCLFVHETLEYLGFVVSSDGIRPGTRKVEDVSNYPVPTSVHSVHSFIGLCSFFRRFVPQFAQIAHPLYKLLRKDATFDFDDDCMNAFEKLKQILTSAPVLGIYDPTSETELHTDASKLGYGAVLLQKQSDNKLHPIAYFSKSVGKHESNYHSYELETLAVVYALGRFRTFLAGIPFTIVTDCNSLVMTFNKKDVNARISRWVLEFENFDFKIKHRGGDHMKHVDALSRNLKTVSSINSYDLYHQLQITQNRDPVIKSLKSTLENSESPPYEMHDGVVYRKNRDNKLLFYVPKEMEMQLIQSIHEKVGHFGSFKCIEKLKLNYWFPGMRAKVESYVKNCIKCLVYSAPNRASEQTLHSIPKKALPFDTIHIDHFGPLPSVKSKQKHILVVIDAFTKYVKVYPCTSTSTSEVCRTLEKYFEFYSRPARLISDRGTCFTSNEFTAFIEKHNIHHIKNAVASPQANGQVERVNRVLKNMLGKLTEPLQHSDWVQQLKHVEYAINNTVQKSVGISPSVLLFGVHQRGPNVDHLTEFLEDSKLHTVDRDLDSIRKESSDNIVKSQESSQAYLSQKSRPTKSYAVDEYVVIRYVDTSAGNKKFTQKFRGPYIIHKVLPNDRYVVRDVEGSQITQIPYDSVVEAKNLKHWRKPT